MNCAIIENLLLTIILSDREESCIWTFAFGHSVDIGGHSGDSQKFIFIIF